MSDLKMSLIEKAFGQFVLIYPCRNAINIDDCFTVAGNRLYFWFNTEDNSTHILSVDLK